VEKSWRGDILRQARGVPVNEAAVAYKLQTIKARAANGHGAVHCPW